MVRLLICDDSPEARTAVRTMLAEEGRVEIVGEAANGEDAVALALETRPDVVLMDVAMPILDGVEATRRLRRLLPSARIVAFAGSDDKEVIAAMIEAGASAYCMKGAPLWELERAVAEQVDPLVRLAHGLAKAGNDAGAAELVARELVGLTGAALAATYLASPDVGLSLGGLAGSAPAASVHSAPGVAARAFEKGALAWADPAELAELRQLGCPATEALAVPLLVDGEALGALLVAQPPGAPAKLDAELVAAAADLAAVSLANVRRLALTYAEARRDALTGLANKRAFNEQLQRASRNAETSGREFSLVLLDIDDFKKVNDQHGHVVGNEVLAELARVIQRTLRADEQAFRVGGEEFAVVIDSGHEVATRVAQRIRAAVNRQQRGRRLPTVSVGVASTRDPGGLDDLFKRADSALYAAKHAGKNRVVVDRGGGVVVAANGEGTRNELEVDPRTPLRVLVVEDEEGIRALLRTTFEVAEIAVDEAGNAESARERMERARPDIIILDIRLPGVNGLEFCRTLKADPATREVPVILLTGADTPQDVARSAGADALLRKPFSPLELLNIVEQLAQGVSHGLFEDSAVARGGEEQLLLYAQDLRRLRELERGQRVLIQRAYRETVTALASALESKDTGTREHSMRVQRYAAELAGSVEPSMLDDPSVEYGFLLHDIGKIGIPDSILQKPGPLTVEERSRMETHTMLGEQMLGHVAVLQGDGLKVVRSHHERWDGGGYPDRLRKDDIPLGARIFAVADTLDAMTSRRPYRQAQRWDEAVAEILGESGKQFDPAVVEAFADTRHRLRQVHYEMSTEANRVSA